MMRSKGRETARSPTGRPVPEHHTSSSMINLARVHDKYGLKKYWEEKIESHGQRMGNEDSRMKNSALSKLREEWVQRLQFRNQHVIESTREQQIRRAQRVQGILRV
ncbi:hypothetical protein G5714_011222 [Onychostoma macrolepis]|uniref:Protein FAM240A n=1 Tax=Onychostoma macrolepis TaxID=369639 RepID=A0A7J6CPM9_9TELE|nr:hypothetical protein G5714_011222 [Onychostoma macrolepis]